MLLFAEEIGKLLANPGSYPVRVSYFPHPAFKFALSSAICDVRHDGSVIMILVPSCAQAVEREPGSEVRPERVPDIEVTRTHLKRQSECVELASRFSATLLQQKATWHLDESGLSKMPSQSWMGT